MFGGGVVPRILNLGTRVQPHTRAALTRHRLERKLNGLQKGLDDLEKRNLLHLLGIWFLVVQPAS